MTEYSTEHLDYLARSYLDHYESSLDRMFEAGDIRSLPAQTFQSVAVKEIGRTWRETGERADLERTYRSQAFITGLHGGGIPLAFLVEASQGTVSLSLASFPGVIRPRTAGDRQPADIVSRLLLGSYPGSSFEYVPGAESLGRVLTLARHGVVGVVTGLPTLRVSDDSDGSTQLDQLIASMDPYDWAMLIMSEPLGGELTRDLIHSLINELRGVENAEELKNRPGPLAEAYSRTLGELLEEYELGTSVGLWTTTAFGIAESSDAFDTLRAGVCSFFGGKDSSPDPIRVTRLPGLGALAEGFGPILVGTTSPPGVFEYPYGFQTLLNSRRLSGICHLPRLEAPGFSVRQAGVFDVTPANSRQTDVALGTIVSRGNPTANRYPLTTSQVNKHALIVGVTGSGKTNSTFQVITQLWSKGVPFLVIEPTKREYRSLLNDPRLANDLCVFTVGNERVSPLRMNPFAVPRGISISTHVDLLKSVFNAAFSMWTVLPQILEQSLHDVYRTNGWDVITGDNPRLNDESDRVEQAFPTLSDLRYSVESVVDRLGYEPNTTSELKAALITRIQSLRIGGKGRMLDTHVSHSMEDLLTRPVVLELEDIGDDDEKSFIIGILLTRIYETLLSRTEYVKSGALRHVVVIEEAHRLLANTSRDVSTEFANARGKAVETFVNMLAEVRAYGEGFVVADQIPTKLAPELLKNTNLKLVHRTVAGEDRRTVADSMNMTDEQAELLATLTTGQAVTFTEGDDRPILIQVDLHDQASRMTERPDNERVGASVHGLLGSEQGSAARDEPMAYPQWIREAAGSPVLRRGIDTVIFALIQEDPTLSDISQSITDLISLGRRELPGLEQPSEALQGLVAGTISLRLRDLGRQYSWAFRDTRAICWELTALVSDAIDSIQGDIESELEELLDGRLEAFSDLYRSACVRGFDPYDECDRTCDQDPPLCLYRYQVGALMSLPNVAQAFSTAVSTSTDSTAVVENLTSAARDATSRLSTRAGAPWLGRASMCLATQFLSESIDIPAASRRRLSSAIAEGLMK